MERVMKREQYEGTRHVLKSDVIFSKGRRLCFKWSYLTLENKNFLRFVEHVDDTSHNPLGCGEIVCSIRNKLYSSVDFGETWNLIYPDIDFTGRVSRCHTLTNGARIVQTTDPVVTYKFDESGDLLDQYNDIDHQWHGSQGIGSKRNGLVLLGEYHGTKPGEILELSVYKSLIETKGWEKVLNLRCGNRPPDGEARHFHICQPIPTSSKSWMLTSGDVGKHNRVWFSHDDGKTWLEPHIDSSALDDWKLEPRRALRLTSFLAKTTNQLRWGTDDTFGKVRRSVLIDATIKRDEMKLEPKAFLGKNACRNIISLTDEIQVILTEAKADSDFAEAIIIEGDRVLETIYLENTRARPSPFTHSLARASPVSGKIYLSGNSGILTSRSDGIIEMGIEVI